MGATIGLPSHYQAHLSPNPNLYDPFAQGRILPVGGIMENGMGGGMGGLMGGGVTRSHTSMCGAGVTNPNRSALPSPNPAAPGTKIFVGGLPNINTDEMREYFAAYGPVADAIAMVRDGIPRGFGFVTFDDAATAQLVLNMAHVIKGKTVELKMADGKR